MGRWLIILGMIFIIAGTLAIFKIPIPFGQLPGDISIQGKNFSFYFPLVSCIILSLILSLLFYIFSK